MTQLAPVRPWIVVLLVIDALFVAAAIAAELWWLVASAVCNAVVLLIINPGLVARAQENQRNIERWGRAPR